MSIELKYDINYFIAKFEAIPEEKWAVGTLETSDGRRCALGHCLFDETINKISSVQNYRSDILINLFTKAKLAGKFKSSIINCFLYNGMSIIELINDGKIAEYQQDSPKKRILAALRDLKNSDKKITITDRKY